MRKIIILIICLINLNYVKADTIVDLNKKGNITITLKEAEDSLVVENAEIEIIKIGEANIVNNNLVFNYVDELKDCKYKLSNENINYISACLEGKKLNSNVRTSDEKGNVIFEGLDLGIYYVRQNNKIENFSQINPFLVMIPKENENSWEYTIDASPKIEIISLTDITIKKIWNTDKEDKILSSVTIELYQNDKKINTVILNKENNWQTTIKNLPKSDNYYIKEINVSKEYAVSYSKNEFVFTVTNTPSLVDTGQMTYLYFIITSLGIIFIGIGFIIKKREDSEK